jgi:hypothetical protein
MTLFLFASARYLRALGINFHFEIIVAKPVIMAGANNKKCGGDEEENRR